MLFLKKLGLTILEFLVYMSVGALIFWLIGNKITKHGFMQSLQLHLLLLFS